MSSMVKYKWYINNLNQAIKDGQPVFPIKFPTAVDNPTVTLTVEDYNASQLALSAAINNNSINNIDVDVKADFVIIDSVTGEKRIQRSSFLNIRFETLERDTSVINTVIIDKPIWSDEKTGQRYYIPMVLNSGYINETGNLTDPLYIKSEGKGELKTYQEHHNPTQNNSTTESWIYYNSTDTDRDNHQYRLGSRVYEDYHQIINTGNKEDLDLYEEKLITKGLPAYRSSIGLSLDTTIQRYIERNINESSVSSTKLGLERLIFMSNRINVLGVTIPEVEKPTAIRDEWCLTSNMLEPKSTRKLSAVEPMNLACFFVGSQVIDGKKENVDLVSVISLLELDDGMEIESVNLHLLTEKSTIIVTNHSNSTKTMVLFHDDAETGKAEVKPYCCVCIIVEGWEISGAPWIVSHDVTTFRYDYIIHNQEEFDYWLEHYKEKNCVYIYNQIEKDINNNITYIPYKISRIYEMGIDDDYTGTVVLEDKVCIAKDEGISDYVYLTITGGAKVINYKIKVNGLLNYPKVGELSYDFLIGSNEALDYYIKNKIYETKSAMYINGTYTLNWDDPDDTSDYYIKEGKNVWMDNAVTVNSIRRIVYGDKVTIINYGNHNKLLWSGANLRLTPVTGDYASTGEANDQLTYSGYYLTENKWTLYPYYGQRSYTSQWVLQVYIKEQVRIIVATSLTNAAVILTSIGTISELPINTSVTNTQWYFNIGAFE